jgi:ribosome-binding factor A
MKHSKTESARELASLCAEPRPDDGLAPHLLRRRERPRNGGGRDGRQAQYCKAVLRALDAGLAGVCGDPRLKDLAVHAVEPCPGGGRLLVIVAAPAAAASAVAELEGALQQAAGLLRSVVAGEVNRRRTPHLSFRVVPEA